MADAGKRRQIINEIRIRILQANLIIQFNTSGSYTFTFQAQLLHLPRHKIVSPFLRFRGFTVEQKDIRFFKSFILGENVDIKFISDFPVPGLERGEKKMFSIPKIQLAFAWVIVSLL